MSRIDVAPTERRFPVGGGQMGASMRAQDWSTFALGPPDEWPPALRVAISLVLNSPESMFLAWGPALLFFFNDAYRPILGPRLDTALGRPFHDLWSDVWDQVSPIVDRALAGTSSRFDDLPLTMARFGVDEQTWWSFSYSPLFDESGAVAGMFCVTNETTQRVLGERALRASERRYRAIFESAIDYAIVVMDLDGIVTNWNSGAAAILGWGSEEMIGTAVGRFFTPDDRDAGIPAHEMASALITGRGADERWHLRKDGSRFWANGEMLALRDDSGTPIGFIKILRDRTEQRNAYARLQASEANLRAIVETVPVGILVAEAPSGRITRRNARMNEIVGNSDGAPKGLADYGDWVAFHVDGTPVAARDYPLSRVIRGEVDEATLEVQYQRRDGSRVWIELTCAGVRDDEGKLTGAVVAVLDIDARKTSEAMQSLINHELSHRMKNLLAMVMAIANQTMRGALDVAAARETLSDRLIALSNAHDILLGGTMQRAPLGPVVRSGVSVLDEETSRFSITGPDVEIGAKAALSLAMIVHELSTNAAKYGALSAEGGRVEVVWSVISDVDEPLLRLEWVESGGPPVVAPTRKGFGSRLIERGFAGRTGGRVTLDYAEAGLKCRVEAPLAGLQAEC